MNKIDNGTCKHKWETIRKEEKVAQYKAPTFLSEGYMAIEWVYTQKCIRCNLINKI